MGIEAEAAPEEADYDPLDVGDLFWESLRLVWAHKFIWLLGFFMGINGLVFSIIRAFLDRLIPAAWLTADYWLAFLEPGALRLPDWLFDSALLGRYLLGGTAAIIIYAVIFWVIVTVAEGSIIGAVLNVKAGTQPRFGPSLRFGVHILGRFAAIDAAVFFPLFVWLLIMTALSLVDAVLVGYLTLATESARETIIGIYAVGWLCILGMACFIVPLMLLSIWYRTLAFRDAAVLDNPVRVALRHTRQIIRQNLGQLIAVTAFIYGISYLLNWLIGLLSLPVLGLTAVPLAGALNTAAVIFSLFLALLIAAGKGLIHAVTAVAWTLAYRHIAGGWGWGLGAPSPHPHSPPRRI